MPENSDDNQGDLSEYRNHLIESRRGAQSDYDKAVISLSGGALGISIAVLKDILGTTSYSQVCLLYSAWICWLISLTTMLISFFTSTQALDAAIEQVDTARIFEELVGGKWSTVTRVLNCLAGAGLIVGILLFVIFVIINHMGGN